MVNNNILNNLVIEISNNTLEAVKKWFWEKGHDYSKKQFVDEVVDSICQRACGGVRYQGKDKMKEMVIDYMENKRPISWGKLKD